MLDQHMILLVFAPATVGLIITALRRATPFVYWAGMLSLITLTWIGLGRMQLGTASTSPMIFMVAAVIVPTVVAFVVGWKLVPDFGGAQIFAGASAAYLLALALVVGAAMLLQRMVP